MLHGNKKVPKEEDSVPIHALQISPVASSRYPDSALRHTTSAEASASTLSQPTISPPRGSRTGPRERGASTFAGREADWRSRPVCKLTASATPIRRACRTPQRRGRREGGGVAVSSYRRTVPCGEESGASSPRRRPALPLRPRLAEEGQVRPRRALSS